MTDRVMLPRPRQVETGRERAPAPAPGAVRATLEPGHRPEGYRLEVTAAGTTLAASDVVGLDRGRATLAQLGNGVTVPEAVVVDWPEFPVRGLMLDVSRDKVPTMDTMRWLVDVMAAWKLNHLQLYMEHTYAYPGHEEVWRNASPFTPEEISELDGYCAARHIELTPNQNCLGHMERWLAHERYRHLAIVNAPPAGLEWVAPFPTTIDPALPGSLELAGALLAELVPRFRSRRVHVGLDEPWNLPAPRMPEYGSYLERLRGIEALGGHEMLVWGDILATHPELISAVPPGVTVCEWGYEADHPFSDRCAALAAAGLPMWVCPGTSGWGSLVGRWTNARGNCAGAARAGRDHGATGYLVTDWGDNGNFQPLPVSLPGLAAAAAAAWNPDAVEDLDYASALGPLVGAGAASALLRLGDAHRAVGPQIPNFASVLMHMWFPQMRVGSGFTSGLDTAQLDAYEAALTDPLASVEPGLVRTELELAVDFGRLAAADGRARLEGDGALRSMAEPARHNLAARADELVERHLELWTVRNRPGGSEDSADRLRHLAQCYREGAARPFLPAWQRHLVQP